MHLRVVSFLALGALALAGCAKPGPGPDLSPPAFHDKPLISLDVGTIHVTHETAPPPRRDHVEHLFPTSLAEGVEIWVRDRLRARGDKARRLDVVIREASAVETAPAAAV